METEMVILAEHTITGSFLHVLIERPLLRALLTHQYSRFGLIRPRPLVAPEPWRDHTHDKPSVGCRAEHVGFESDW